jgi:hypothetical protein
MDLWSSISVTGQVNAPSSPGFEGSEEVYKAHNPTQSTRSHPNGVSQTLAGGPQDGPRQYGSADYESLDPLEKSKVGAITDQ